MLEFKITNRNPDESEIYAYQFSCLNKEQDCSLCKELDGCVVDPKDPTLKHLKSDKKPDEQNPYGYLPENWYKLCKCKDGCACMWVGILKNEVFPPNLHFPKELREKILKSEI